MWWLNHRVQTSTRGWSNLLRFPAIAPLLQHALFHSFAQSHQLLTISEVLQLQVLEKHPEILLNMQSLGPLPEHVSHWPGREPRTHRFNKLPRYIMLQVDSVRLEHAHHQLDKLCTREKPFFYVLSSGVYVRSSWLSFLRCLEHSIILKHGRKP